MNSSFMPQFFADVAYVSEELRNLRNSSGNFADVSTNILDKLNVMIKDTCKMEDENLGTQAEYQIRWNMIRNLNRKIDEAFESKQILFESILRENDHNVSNDDRDDITHNTSIAHVASEQEVVPDQFFNTEIKKCAICRALSDMNILIVTDEKECPLCTTVVNRLMAFKCGHSCCCFNCFKEIKTE